MDRHKEAKMRSKSNKGRMIIYRNVNNQLIDKYVTIQYKGPFIYDTITEESRDGKLSYKGGMVMR